MSYQSRTIAELLADLCSFGAWLSDRGIDYRRTRIGDYVRFYQDIVKQPPAPASLDELNRAIYTLRGVDELLWIFRGLQVQEPPGYLEPLRESIGGLPFTRDDGTNRRARDRQLELRIASYFLQTGFPVDLSQAADLTLEVDGATIQVECKRLVSHRKVQQRLREAARQLRKRYQKRRGSLGLVALDVSMLLRPEQGLVTASSGNYSRSRIMVELNQFIDDFDISAPFRGDKKLLGVWVQTLTPVLQLAEQQPATIFSSINYQPVPLTGRKAEIFKLLEPAFQHS